jgi:hypothetical protein
MAFCNIYEGLKFSSESKSCLLKAQKSEIERLEKERKVKEKELNA